MREVSYQRQEVRGEEKKGLKDSINDKVYGPRVASFSCISYLSRLSHEGGGWQSEKKARARFILLSETTVTNYFIRPSVHLL